MLRTLAFLTVFAWSASAQATVAAGSRVRTIPSDTAPSRTGKVTSLSTDSITVKFETVSGWNLRVDTLNVPRVRLEVLTSTRSRRGPAMLVGGIAGAFIGFGVGSKDQGQLCEGSPAAGFTCHKDESVVLPLEVLGGLAGVLAGAFVGHFLKTEVWQPVVPR